jgi:hypothetical protein
MSTCAKKKSKSECPVCYATHDEEIHQATLRIRRWFSERVTVNFSDQAGSEPELQSEMVAS